MNYTLNQLQVFLKVAQTQSVTRASEELNLTQPAVSIQLKNFQDQFDRPLTEVVGRKLYVTEFGKEIAKAAEAVLEQVAGITAMTQASKGLLTGRLKLSIVSTGQYVMPLFLAPFMKKNAELDLQMDVTNRNRVVENLAQNSVDFALLSFLPQAPHLEKLDLVENKFFLVGSAKEKLKKNARGKQSLKELPLIFREKGSGTRQTMEAFIKRSKLAITPKMELTSNDAVKQAVMAGLGFSIMPLIGIRNELQTGHLQIIPVSGLPIKTMWRLVWLKGKRHSPAATAFLDFVRTEKTRIIDEHFSFESIL